MSLHRFCAAAAAVACMPFALAQISAPAQAPAQAQAQPSAQAPAPAPAAASASAPGPGRAPAQAQAQAQAQREVRHTVAPGDTLMGIAQRYLGDPSLWREVQRVNPSIRDDRRLRPGSTVVVPLPPPGPVAIHVNGKASFTRAGQTKELAQGAELQEKDTIDVQASSYVTLRWPEGIVTHLLPGSSLRLVPPTKLGNPRAHMLELKGGTAESQVPPGLEGMSFQIRTRLGTAAVRGTGFGVRLGDASMITDVTQGAVKLAPQGLQPVDLPAGSGAVADASGKQPRAVPLLPAPQVQVDTYVTTDGSLEASAIAGAMKYEFELAPASSPEAILRRVSSDTPVFRLEPLREGDWRVRVRAVDEQGIPGQPGMRIFAAIAFPAPAPGRPTNNALVGQDAPGRFLCAEVPGAVSYEIVVTSADAQRDPIRITAAPNCEAAVPVLPLGRYRWQATASRQVPGGRLLRSQPSAFGDFTVVPRPATPAPEVRPTSGVGQQVLAWEASPGASYVVQVAFDTSFDRLVAETRVTAPQATVTVQPGKTVYVRVRAVLPNGVASDYSQPRVLQGPPATGSGLPSGDSGAVPNT